MGATLTSRAGALRHVGRGRVTLACDVGFDDAIALVQPGARVCWLDRFDQLGPTLDALRRHELLVVTEGLTDDHDLRRLVGDWWESGRDVQTTRRGLSQRSIVCVHRGEPSRLLRAAGEWLYTLAVVPSWGVPEALRHLRENARIAILDPESWAIAYARSSGYEPIDRGDDWIVLG